MAVTLVQQNGGVGGLVQQLQRGGLGEIVSLWVSAGANRSVTPAQLEQALGGTAVTQAAAAAGVDPPQAMGAPPCCRSGSTNSLPMVRSRPAATRC